MKKYKIVNKIRFYGFVIVVVYISFSMLWFFKSFSRAEDVSSNLNYEEIYVQSGDTVWSIALDHNHINTDPRDIVAEIRTLNNLDDVIIKPGDKIKIPSIKK